ncbi:MAG: septum formation inhibitor Maf [Desulfobacteraceae bacterium 4572_88]|nr:MAG: septum formation inhibitor Maf [Desulfobacteraceae bacterium 4572_88]
MRYSNVESSPAPLLILASQSPRRKYLLEQAGLSFTVIPASFDEDTVPLQSPENYVKIMARAKAGTVSENYPDKWVIGADTVVFIDGTILGKPGSRNEARAMLKRLSGQTHQVFTGYCICCKAKNREFSESIKTDVLFKNLSNEEVEWYIRTKEPFDKAGAYAIQGLGTFLVKHIDGSYTNIVGLPVCEVIEFLIREGVVGLRIESGAFTD